LAVKKKTRATTKPEGTKNLAIVASLIVAHAFGVIASMQYDILDPAVLGGIAQLTVGGAIAVLMGMFYKGTIRRRAPLYAGIAGFLASFMGASPDGETLPIAYAYSVLVAGFAINASVKGLGTEWYREPGGIALYSMIPVATVAISSASSLGWVVIATTLSLELAGIFWASIGLRNPSRTQAA
jgi:hypothetical protein